MNKEKTIQLKGIAILLMMWLHLFSNESNIEQCSPFLYFWNGDVLAYAMRKICSICVGIYVFLGGYGLTKTYIVKKGEMQNHKRVIALYKKLWIIFFLFFPLGLIFNDSVFKTSLDIILLNATALDCSFNGEWWFFFPYVVLTLLSKHIIKRVLTASTIKEWLMVGGAIALFVFSYFDDLFISDKSLGYLLALNILRFCSMLLYFIIGILFVKHKIFERLTSRYKKVSTRSLNLCVTAFLLAFSLLKMSIGASSLLNPPFVLLFLLCLVSLRIEGYTEKFLTLLGLHSANIWLVHSFFINRIFVNDIFQLNYIPIIFLSLLIISLLVSEVVRRIESRFFILSK